MMSSTSPPLAFEPTPAIEAIDKEYSAKGGMEKTHTGIFHDGRGASSKEVHFSPLVSPARRAQSIATSVPLLDPVSSASEIPQPSFRSRNVTPHFDINAYIEQSRMLMEKQRLNFERERRAFEEERNLWNAERAMMQAKIAELELTVNNSTHGKRRYSTESSAQSSRSDFGHSLISSNHASRLPSHSSSAPPVWDTPDTSGTVTRVFSNEDPLKRASNNTLPSIAEAGSLPAHDRSPSPHSKPMDQARNMPIPIEMIDSELDGITLKSSRLPSSFSGTIERLEGDGFTLKSTSLPPSLVAKVITPPKAFPDSSSLPSSKANEGSLNAIASDLSSPADEKLIMHAGHTPMAIGSASAGSASSQSTQMPTPKNGTASPPKRQSPSKVPARPPMRPSENSDSYFETAIIRQDGPNEQDPDPRLKEPLTLESIQEHGKENSFLNELDAKLLTEAKKHLRSPIDSMRSDDESRKIEADHDDGIPQLRIKKSTNFGSVYGSKRPGNI